MPSLNPQPRIRVEMRSCLHYKVKPSAEVLTERTSKQILAEPFNSGGYEARNPKCGYLAI